MVHCGIEKHTSLCVSHFLPCQSVQWIIYCGLLSIFTRICYLKKCYAKNTDTNFKNNELIVLININVFKTFLKVQKFLKSTSLGYDFCTGVICNTAWQVKPTIVNILSGMLFDGWVNYTSPLQNRHLLANG